MDINVSPVTLAVPISIPFCAVQIQMSAMTPSDHVGSFTDLSLSQLSLPPRQPSALL